MGAVRLPDSLRAAGLVHAKQKPLQRHSVELSVRPQIARFVSANLLDVRRSCDAVELEKRR